MKKAKNNIIGGFDEYIKANRKAAREIELETNGGRWVAKNRPHKNLKKYDRKRDRKIDFGLFNFSLTSNSQYQEALLSVCHFSWPSLNLISKIH